MTLNFVSLSWHPNLIPMLLRSPAKTMLLTISFFKWLRMWQSEGRISRRLPATIGITISRFPVSFARPFTADLSRNIFSARTIDWSQ